MTSEYDLILKGGEVIDPSQNLRGIRDVGFKDGKVAVISENLPSERASRVADVSGKLVLPGLIDLHTHFAYEVVPYCADPDRDYLPIGVTTAVDTGSTGWMNFPVFRKLVIERAETNLFAFIHVSSIGTMMMGALDLPDLVDFRLVRVDEAIRCIEENRDVLLGVKVRLAPDGTTVEHAVPALKIARRIADETNTLLMIHVMNSVLPIAEVLEYLKPGDVATHIFQGTEHNILDDKSKVREEVWTARKSGVIFDTACAAQHYSIPVCQAAIDQGLLPHTISTDFTTWPTNKKRYDLLGIMTIFHALGMSLEDVATCVTSNPASVIARSELGSLSVDAVGDASVLELEDGNFSYTDSLGHEVSAKRRFAPVLTVRRGRVWESVPAPAKER